MNKNKIINNEEINYFEQLDKEENQEAEFGLSCMLLDIESKKLLIDKLKAEIKKVKTETAIDKVNIDNAKLKNTNGYFEMEMESRRIENIKTKLYFLKEVLNDHVIDSERTILGSEPICKPLLENADREITMHKLMSLIKEL